MGRKNRISKGKTMKPNFFVFCEGETEITYIRFLRSIYRVPLQIIAKKSDSNITMQYIANCKKEYEKTDNDKTFLMFDLDVSGILEKLQKIADCILLVSNPCVEFWFLLHYEDVRAELTSKNCIERLKKHSIQYSKGTLSDTEKRTLSENKQLALERAQKLKEYRNPSSMVYRLIEELEKVK